MGPPEYPPKGGTHRGRRWCRLTAGEGEAPSREVPCEGPTVPHPEGCKGKAALLCKHPKGEYPP